VSPISVPTCSRRLDTVAAPKPFYPMRDGRLVPDPRSHPPAAASVEVRRRNGKLKNLMRRIAEEARQHGAELWLAPIGTEVQENGMSRRTAAAGTRWGTRRPVSSSASCSSGAR
jgi:hypothetical protein